jgi:hypothetical protein
LLPRLPIMRKNEGMWLMRPRVTSMRTQ